MASLKTKLQKQIVEECGCEAFVVSAEVASYYSYKLLSTTNLSLPTEQWTDEFAPLTTLTNTMSWAIPLTSSGSKFFRVVEMGLGAYATVILDAASPLPSTILISTTNGTHNVPLIVYDVKSHVTNSVLRNATIVIVANSPTSNIACLFSAIKLRVGELTYTGQVISTGTSQLFGGSYGWKVAFSDMTIPLPADIYVPITITADAVTDTNGTLDGTQVLAGDGGISLDIEDPGYLSVLPSETAPLQGTTFTLNGQSAFVSNISASLGAGIVSNNVIVSYPMSFSFMVTAGNQTLFVSSSPTTFTEAVAGIGAVVNLPLAGMIANPGQLAGDFQTTSSNGYYIIPVGSSRQFTFNGSIGNGDGMSGIKSASIIGINYGTSISNLTAHTISYGLQNLRVNASF